MSARAARSAFAAFLAVLCSTGCRNSGGPEPGHPAASSHATAPGLGSSASASADWFVDKADEAGLTWTHFNGMSGRFYYPEIIGPGVALFDYDNDGDLDVFLVQGTLLGSGTPALTPPAAASSGGRLFRNDLIVHADGTRTLHFTDVTGPSGIRAAGYGMGAAAGDFDNDGCVDLLVTNLGPNQLWHNNCDGTFSDVSKALGQEPAAGRVDPSWSVSAAFVDIDRDGWLDLFVGHYLNYTIAANTACFSPSGRPDYCSPNVYSPQSSRLYHNNRNGTFTDITAAAGMAREVEPALGVATADFNNDGWVDIYVTNDGQPNQLWINQRNGTFSNLGVLSGTAMSAHGKAKAGMGVDAGDFDNDGDEDLIVANLRGEGSDLYVNDGSGLFEEQGSRSGLAVSSQPYTGFGAAWLDLDNDGWLDALVVNGAVQTLEKLRQVNDPFPLHQPKLLFRNAGNGRLEDATSGGGAAFQLSDVSRGAAFGDIDNDGDIDVVVANNSGKARLLINEIGQRNHWVGLRLVGRQKRDMLGARVAVTRADGVTVWRRARADGSYASANDPRVLAGLGQSAAPVHVQVIWPDGTMERWNDVAADRYTTITQGSGR